jgi:hypothetical protein
MHLKRVFCASATAFGIGVSALTAGTFVANAAPPPCPPQTGCQGGPPGGAPPPQHDQGGQQGQPPPQHDQGGPPQGFPGNGPGDRHDQGDQGGPPDFHDQGGPPDFHDQGGPPDFHGQGGPQDFHGQGGPDFHDQGPQDWRRPDYRGGPGGPEWGPPPPDLAWRGIDDGRRDHQPFNYNNNWVEPIYSPVFNNWGFWFFGAWIPL